MKNTLTHVTNIQENLESVAFLISRGNFEKEAHTKIVQSLVSLAQLELRIKDMINEIDFDRAGRIKEQINNSLHVNGNNEIDAEIKKVKRKVLRWFKNPHQYNSTILNYFLALCEENSKVTITMLRNKCDEIDAFDANYNQMKNFGMKNHGKVFEESNGMIVLWEPVKDFILERYKSNNK